MSESKKKRTPFSIAFSALCIFLIIVLSIILIGNVTFIIKGALSPDAPPTVFGVLPLVTLSGSMEGDMEDSFGAGSLVVMTKPTEIEIGDIIAFKDPSAKELVIVSHRVVDIIEEDGEVRYVTQGDANNTPDMDTIGQEDLIGEYLFHFEKLGTFALFLREPIGMLLFIGLPVLLFIVYDIIRHKLNDKKKASKNAEMEAELERLRALAAENQTATQSDTADTENNVS
ncbi:MAG: signal peptidase I [Clostridia bacterium]|nr:signal peptidase I [Clostridia bacterium]